MKMRRGGVVLESRARRMLKPVRENRLDPVASGVVALGVRPVRARAPIKGDIATAKAIVFSFMSA